jgi:hypothetical protein
MPRRQQSDSVHSSRFHTETWTRKTYGSIRGDVSKRVVRNADGTFRGATNVQGEVPILGRARRVV